MTLESGMSEAYNRSMRYEGRIYRPPSEADSLILQATIGCSWNHCTYCDMYRDKSFRIRDLNEILADIALASSVYGNTVQKVFIADGDALVMPLHTWEPILNALRETFPALRRVSSYATARNILEKSPGELTTLRELGLSMFYIGPESGDDETLKRIAKGGSFDEHAEAGAKLRSAGIKQSVIFLLGAGGVERSAEHAVASGRLLTAMDPEYSSALTLTIIPHTPIGKLAKAGRFELPDIQGLLKELRLLIEHASPSNSVFRSNHASNYLPIGGRLPRDRGMMLSAVDAALSGDVPLRPEWSRG
ncbi:MAG: radical SAM protein, partial [Planctomycetes bacterium]|nr:radical SAM protein [Planctomycetota bacterium]